MKRLVLLISIFAYLCGAANMYASNRFPRENNTIRIMSYNIRNGIGLDNVTDYKRTAQVIRSLDPDVVALQEVDSVTGRSKGVDVLNKLADYTGMYAVYGKAINFGGGKYGIGVMSKEKPLSSQNIPLPGREEARTLLVIEFDKYVVFATHFSLTSEDRMASIDIINNLAERYNKPAFLIGDLNAKPESEEIKKISEEWKMLNNPKQGTYPANEPRQTIDYIFGYEGKGQIYSVYQADVVNEPVASDHRPLFTDVRLKE